TLLPATSWIASDPRQPNGTRSTSAALPRGAGAGESSSAASGAGPAVPSLAAGRDGALQSYSGLAPASRRRSAAPRTSAARDRGGSGRGAPRSVGDNGAGSASQAAASAAAPSLRPLRMLASDQKIGPMFTTDVSAIVHG